MRIDAKCDDAFNESTFTESSQESFFLLKEFGRGEGRRDAMREIHVRVDSEFMKSRARYRIKEPLSYLASLDSTISSSAALGKVAALDLVHPSIVIRIPPRNLGKGSDFGLRDDTRIFRQSSSVATSRVERTPNSSKHSSLLRSRTSSFP